MSPHPPHRYIRSNGHTRCADTQTDGDARGCCADTQTDDSGDASTDRSCVAPVRPPLSTAHSTALSTAHSTALSTALSIALCIALCIASIPAPATPPTALVAVVSEVVVEPLDVLVVRLLAHLVRAVTAWFTPLVDPWFNKCRR
jgi:hypothetical protein